MYNVVCWSGGKDSTASIILAHENNIRIDLILMSEVMFDNRKGISGENPLHMDFVYNKAIPLFESWGYKVAVLRSESDFLEQFYHIIENPTKHVEHKGMHYGFPVAGLCSIKRELKEKPIKKYLKELSKSEEILEYVGICSDEYYRLRSMKRSGNKVSILEQFHYKKDMTGPLCEKYNLLSPTYSMGVSRGGCWFCPFAKEIEHLYIKTNYPDAWERYVALEHVRNVAFDKWSVYDNETLIERDKRLSLF